MSSQPTIFQLPVRGDNLSDRIETNRAETDVRLAKPFTKELEKLTSWRGVEPLRIADGAEERGHAERAASLAVRAIPVDQRIDDDT